MRMLPVQTVPPAHRAPRARRLALQRLNVRKILLAVSIVAVILIVILVIRSILIGHSRNRKRRDIMKRHRSRKDEIIDFDRYTDPFA